MAFTQGELDSIAAAALDYHWRGQPLPQNIQDKPLLRSLEANRKTFPGGKELITMPVKGKYAFEGSAPQPGNLKGYTHNDTVAYGNIAGIMRASFAWKEVHTGWSVTFTELKIDGITVTDSVRGSSTSNHSKRELTAITNIMQDKVETFSEIVTKQLNDMFWGDGTADALGFLGIRHFITATPGSNTTTGNINRQNNAWWRNRYLSINPSTAQMPLELHKEFRQLRRYGGNPKLVLCGSAFLDALIAQLYAKGNFTEQGWSKPSSTEIGVADVTYNGIKFEYDPTLDDLSLSKNCYVVDTRRLFVQAMEDEWGRDHNPARPHNSYALYKAKTYTGQLVANQLNCHGLYVIP